MWFAASTFPHLAAHSYGKIFPQNPLKFVPDFLKKVNQLVFMT
ncbi:hypothetical protein SAMN05216327_106234 [Dyadobacter sp. SG02]|nr:hypothetical protein SAMN05216327_106234 [Dyadobacter sp. SG02]